MFNIFIVLWDMSVLTTLLVDDCEWLQGEILASQGKINSDLEQKV